MNRRERSVAIVGATGAVGREFLRVMEDRRFRVSELRLISSERSAGSTMVFRGEPHPVSVMTDRSFDGIDVAFFSAGGSVSREHAPRAVARGATVIDNSSAFRMAEGVPLVVPEVNPEALAPIRGKPAIIANPNCSTIIMLVAVTPLRRNFGVRRVVVSTYQAVSGAGAAAMEELETLTRAAVEGRKAEPRIFREPCAFNCFSHDSAMDPRTGRNLEEQKMIDETRKMWGDPAARVFATCIRVPVPRAHSEAIVVELERPASEDQVRAAFAAAPGVRVLDDRASNDFPTPAKAAGRDEVLVGRIRPDESLPSESAGGRTMHSGWALWACGDQLRKGAALNAVQIAEALDA